MSWQLKSPNFSCPKPNLESEPSKASPRKLPDRSWNDVGRNTQSNSKTTECAMGLFLPPRKIRGKAPEETPNNQTCLSMETREDRSWDRGKATGGETQATPRLRKSNPKRASEQTSRQTEKLKTCTGIMFCCSSNPWPGLIIHLSAPSAPLLQI